MLLLGDINYQRCLGLLLFFAMLFSQIQPLYACDSMADKPKHVCCCGDQNIAVCPMADNCNMQEKLADTACCEVSYEVINEAGMINSASTVDQLTLLLDGPQPPPDIGLISSFVTPSQIFTLLSRTIDDPLIFHRNEPTYLLTRRIRI